MSGVKRGAACVAPFMDLVAPYSQKTGTEQPLEPAKLHDKLEDSQAGASYCKVLLLLILFLYCVIP